MDNNNVMDDAIMDLDLNQEPTEPSTEPVGGLGILLDELESAHDQIEERIRRLEALTARARQRQRWRQAHNLPGTSNLLFRDGINQNEVNRAVSLQEGTVDRAKCCKRDSSHLVAKALEMDTDENEVGYDGGFFDCNICLDMAREPILTCCGHLFCWACFYQLPYIYSSAKECPVCKGEVTDANITPIYGNGRSADVMKSDHGLTVPPRPQAHRVESVRQQRIHRGISHIPVAEALRRIRMEIRGATGEVRTQDQDGGASPNTTELGGRWRLRTRQFSRILPDSATSLYSISSALDNTERLVDDLESFMHGRLPGSSRTQVLSLGSEDQQTQDSNASSSQTLENLRDYTATAIAEPRPSSSSRRRIRLSTVSDPDSGISRELRRRRLG